MKSRMSIECYLKMSRKQGLLFFESDPLTTVGSLAVCDPQGRPAAVISRRFSQPCAYAMQAPR